MVDVRVSAASGTSADWAASTLVLGVGQLAWETDTQILRIGDGSNLEPNLPIVAQPQTIQYPVIDDNPTDVSNFAVWSSQNTQAQIAAALQQANAYTDQAMQGVLNGTGLPIAVAFQNSDGSWGNRPGASCVFAFTTNGSTTAPNWLQPGIDVLFYRN